MDPPGLPDPADYTPPRNGDQRRPTVEITPYPADPPNVTGDQVTFNVYQR